MNQSRFYGDEHVKGVYQALQSYFHTGDWPECTHSGCVETARFLWGKFPSITDIECKFSYENSDQHNDLTIKTKHGNYPVNLYQISGTGNIQPKNLGAKSFLSKYFLAPDLQENFNTLLETHYSNFIRDMLETKNIDMDRLYKVEAKRVLREKFKKFDNNSNTIRDAFLFSLREECYSILLESYNLNKDGFTNAFTKLLMLDETTIITRFNKNNVTIEEFKPTLESYNAIKIYKKGRNSLGIQSGQVALTLRFKFENAPYSSIKLATSYEHLENLQDFSNNTRQFNMESIRKAEQISSTVDFIEKDNTSNAIGKCHEAYAYYWMLKRFPNVIQTDDEDFLKYLRDYLPYISQNTVKHIKESSEKTAITIADYIQQRYPNANLESLQLVADIYVKDRLNTGDIKICVREEQGTLTELYISLKALRSENQKITTKNPGIGQILGPNFFDLNNDLASEVSEAKATYDIDHNHDKALITISEIVGEKLQAASQHNLKRGIENLLGKALTIITIYEQSKAYLLQHDQINSFISVKRNTPTKYQNTFVWGNGTEELSLRIKFSRGHSHGWSSLKFASEYSFKPKQL